MYQKNVTIKLCALIVICIFIAFPLLAGGTKPEEEAMERPAKAEVITITVWDQFGYEGLTAAGPSMDKLVEIYEEDGYFYSEPPILTSEMDTFIIA